MKYDIWSSCIFVPGFSRTECASWVQALGSILAICAAIGIAWWQRSEERGYAKDLELAKGSIVADELLFSMISISARLAALADSMHPFKNEISDFLPNRYLTSLQQIELPSNEVLLAIAPSWPKAARFISEARTVVKFAINQLTGLSENGVLDQEKAKPAFPRIHQSLYEGYYLLVAAHQIIRPEDIRPDVFSHRSRISGSNESL